MISLLASATAEAVTANPGILETIQKTFGLNGPFFIAQVINFFVVIFVLKKFAFGPIQAMLEQRRIRIAEGEEKLKRIEKQLAESEQTTASAPNSNASSAASSPPPPHKSPAKCSPRTTKNASTRTPSPRSKLDLQHSFSAS